MVRWLRTMEREGQLSQAIGTWKAIVVTACLLASSATTLGCSGGKCPNLDETPCESPGLHHCDECGNSWVCLSDLDYRQTNVPCECITEDGRRLNYIEDTGETGVPTNNPACDSQRYEGPD